MDMQKDGFTEVTSRKNKGKKADKQPNSKNIGGVRLSKPKPSFYRPKEPVHGKANSSKQKEQNAFEVLNTLDVEEESGIPKPTCTKKDSVGSTSKSSSSRLDQGEESDENEVLSPKDGTTGYFYLTGDGQHLENDDLDTYDGYEASDTKQPKQQIVEPVAPNKLDAPVDIEGDSVSMSNVENQACNYGKGRWVKDDSRPLYSEFGCKQWLSGMWACRLTQRTDFGYKKLKWQPKDCKMDDFTGPNFLKRSGTNAGQNTGLCRGFLRAPAVSVINVLTGGEERHDVEDVGKKYGLVKVRGSVRPDGWAYRFPITNTTILYYWSASLCELDPIDPINRTTYFAMHLDRPPAFLQRYISRFNVLVLNTGITGTEGNLMLTDGLYGSTLLHVAAIVGNTDAAKILVEINHDLLFPKDKEGQTPLSRALSNMHTDTYLYLLNPTNTRDIKLDNLFVGTSGDELLINAISANDYHSTLVLSKHYRNLNSDSVLMAIAQNFPRKLDIWESMTYACVFEDPTVTLAAVICVLLTTPVLVSGIKFKTALKSFTSAVVVFSFAGVIMSIDPFGNNLLHLAARLAPTSKLSLISGAVLQIQRELQWFKEVEGFVCPLNRIQKNSFGEMPKMVFTREHRELVTEGEKWMKATAESYTITAALITTIVFAAAITVPGGNNQDTGIPVFSNDAFTIFAISDAISLFTSTTSLLMFLSILTTRFAEEDFLFNLPTKLIIGLSTLSSR
ncbi:trichome birefringence-like protein 14 [Tanacetum coccineum]